MPKMIQVRNVPDGLHRELVRRARARGQTLTDFIQEILEREVARPDPQEVFRRIRESEPVDLGISAAELVREGRMERDAGMEKYWREEG
jgi:plasmid stability protein